MSYQPLSLRRSSTSFVENGSLKTRGRTGSTTGTSTCISPPRLLSSSECGRPPSIFAASGLRSLVTNRSAWSTEYRRTSPLTGSVRAANASFRRGSSTRSIGAHPRAGSGTPPPGARLAFLAASASARVTAGLVVVPFAPPGTLAALVHAQT